IRSRPGGGEVAHDVLRRDRDMVQQCLARLLLVALRVIRWHETLVAKEDQHTGPVDGIDGEVLRGRRGGMIQHRELAERLDAGTPAGQNDACDPIAVDAGVFALDLRNRANEFPGCGSSQASLVSILDDSDATIADGAFDGAVFCTVFCGHAFSLCSATTGWGRSA